MRGSAAAPRRRCAACGTRRDLRVALWSVAMPALSAARALRQSLSGSLPTRGEIAALSAETRRADGERDAPDAAGRARRAAPLRQRAAAVRARRSQRAGLR